ncbi:hypothetical protein VHEMI07652 [[Torrubiella] hemipterigena]|uniref:Peptidase M43 pregnancy-associated plasma-A domain-containing protein n=1 Tax=[Torrubiella] hemipterigena TaxID=1531966 RepID=A0A0A1TNA8_9HYPO|nr:hypothetical protein VHEMI07652 [[Torrubiella] hemipterigena]
MSEYLYNANFTAEMEQDIVANTYIHVVAESKERNGGYLTQAEVDSQFAQLNKDFQSAGIKFELKETTYTVNKEWAHHKGANYNYAMKKKLRMGKYAELNLYYIFTFGGRLAGYCNYPEANVRDLVGDGCVMDHRYLPGSGGYFGEGKVTTHEVGHWLHLIHTFEGQTCGGKGDQVDDTPPEGTINRDYPEGTDSCPNHPGKDPIHNHMDYTSDACRTEFTPGQVERAKKAWAAYRKGK